MPNYKPPVKYIPPEEERALRIEDNRLHNLILQCSEERAEHSATYLQALRSDDGSGEAEARIRKAKIELIMSDDLFKHYYQRSVDIRRTLGHG